MKQNELNAYEAPPATESKPQKLTSENLKAVSDTSAVKKPKAPSKAASKRGRGAKPAWATTEKQAEEEKEAEIDDLLEFAYELDYEKYMEDYEVRQALGIIKDRVREMTQDEDWKQKMADEWNQANQEP